MRHLRTWAWLCIAAWLLMLVGPLLHAAGHEDDHVHVHGGIVHHSHSHSGDTPRDLIGKARLADRSDAPEDTPPDEPRHGFDAKAHFIGAAPLLSPPTIALLPPADLPHVEPTARPTARRSRGAWQLPEARGPPRAQTPSLLQS